MLVSWLLDTKVDVMSLPTSDIYTELQDKQDDVGAIRLF